MGKILSAFVTTIFPVISVVKQDDETKTTDTVLTDDTEIKGQLSKKNHAYSFTLLVFFQSGTVPDLKYSIAIPSGTAIMNTNVWQPDAVSDTTDATATTVQATGDNPAALQITGVIITGDTIGEVNFQWAQNTSSATATTIKAGTNLIVWS